MTDTAIPREWLHPASFEEAARVQRELAARVVMEDDLGIVRTLAGADISHQARIPDAPVHAAIVTLDWPSLAVTGQASVSEPPTFPYRPGFLGFRECPSLVHAYKQLAAAPPDLIFVDGQGFSHPRGFGIACQLGVLLDRPTIGVAKSILVGKPEGELGLELGDQVPLVWRGRQVGVVLRSKPRCNPLYISVGHRIALPTAVDWVLRTLRGYRMPEPTRQAHIAANVMRRAA